MKEIRSMPKTISIGHQNFESIITNNYFYIDKTDFIRQWRENGDSVTLITRPRRFGKTLNMSMLEQYFSINYANRSDLFENLFGRKRSTKNCREHFLLLVSALQISRKQPLQMPEKHCVILLKNYTTAMIFYWKAIA